MNFPITDCFPEVEDGLLLCIKDIVPEASLKEQATQQSGGITIPGSDQKACGCGSWRNGLVANMVGLVNSWTSLF